MVRSRGGRRIGIFGGTFDPPHIGHLVAAIDAQHALDLDLVLLTVANVPWQKAGSREISAAEDRLAMVRAAVAETPYLEASDLELQRGGPSYTADTLDDLRRIEPDAHLFVILGDDAASGFTTWERYEEVAAGATLVVVDRPGEPTPVDERFTWVRVDIPELELSSTELRARVGDGRSIRHLTPEGVAAWIDRRGLYR
ncbi:nicotinate-nucleotide adenylyltransferase [Aquihabitans sp. McL0605]|uniref:nicotinate-nucleotide adenylyltransferase n=1 Tax=Aquihabitans sp. McL0605 TaxID=3415671 RepID=UPI003CF77BD2